MVKQVCLPLLVIATNADITLLNSKMAHLSPPVNPGISMTRYGVHPHDKIWNIHHRLEVFLPKKLNLHLESSLLGQVSLQVWSRGPLHLVVHKVKTSLIILRHDLPFSLSFSRLYSGVFYRLLGVYTQGIQKQIWECLLLRQTLETCKM